MSSGLQTSVLATALRGAFSAIAAAVSGVADAGAAAAATLEATLPAWLYASLQTAFVVVVSSTLFVCAISVAWVLLWKLVLSKIRFVVALKNELLLGQPSRPMHARRRHHAHST
mmetsp:Transcript_28790/g.84372  ORF Transcript_28790/g.84372 Transcript_28790/m.84372 type:complete len:114 (-) Transcript_28790:323-664(-)